MKLSVQELNALASRWRTARRLYPVYTTISHQFELGLLASPELECPIDRTDPEVFEKAAKWLEQAESAIHAHHLRLYCQTHTTGEPTLRALIARHLDHHGRDAQNRDKVDFLLVQYFAQCAPISMHRDDLRFFEVANILEPVLGEHDAEIPKSAAALEDVLVAMRESSTFKDLLAQGLLARARQLKIDSGNDYFEVDSLIAFTRYNFLARRIFFALMRAEVGAVAAGLSELRARGVSALDCTSLGGGAKDSIEKVGALCADWKAPFRAEYSAGANFEKIVQFRTHVEKILAETPTRSKVAATANAGMAADAGEPASPVSAQLETSSQLTQGEYAQSPSRIVPSLPVNEPGEATSTNASFSSAERKLQSLKEQLVEHLKGFDCSQKVATRLVIAGRRLLLSSWEVRAFAKSGEQFAEGMQCGVAARVLLEMELETARRNGAADLGPVLQLVHAEAARLQEQVAEARDARDIDAAVTLAATSRRLIQLMEEAEKLARSGA